ncbi:MAG: Do family serine endopeptidase [Alphaproteobacteria bacterium]|nr:Do family serine endopeptidase [Alphaproteobacteria bacterium]
MATENTGTQQPKRHAKLLAAGVAAVLVLGGLGAFALIPRDHAENTTAAGNGDMFKIARADDSSTPRMVENGAPFSFADLVERVSPAVVTITVEETQSPSQTTLNLPDNIPDPFREFFRRFGENGPGFQLPRKSTSMGSGFIISKSGYIVTNNHVVDHGTKITVKLPDGRSFDAKLIGKDPATDIALLKIKSDKPLPTVEFGDDRQLRVGDWVVAVGNPFGLSNTVTAGIVSSIGRNIGNGPYTDFIQIDAPINRGNSGGPTFDLRGHVVGMNTMIFSPSGGSVGIGFAIPSTTIHHVVAQLQAHGKVTRGWLGIQIQSITPDIASSLGMKEPHGAIVASVVSGSPADKAGFKQGDVVLALNGASVEDARDLTRRVAALAVGSEAKFTVSRNGDSKTLTAKIAQRSEDQNASNDNSPSTPQSHGSASALGLSLSALTPDVRRTFNLPDNVQGAVVTNVDPDSDAAQKGIRSGDVILSVANREVRSPKDVENHIADARKSGRKTILMLVSTNGTEHFVAVDLK